MRQVSRGFLLVAATMALAACASHAPVTSAATAAVPAADTSGVPKGYFRKTKGHKDYFCRLQAVTGSHTLKTEICVTPDEYAAGNTGTASLSMNPDARQQH